MPIPAPIRGAIADPGARPIRLPRSLIAAGVLAAALLAPGAALGHAELDTITPTDKSTTSGSPTEIVATFSEALDAGASSLKIVDASNAVIVQGSVVGADRTTMTLPISTPLQAGVYTVRWTSKSAADGDLDHGTTTFTVAASSSAAPSVGPSTAPPSAGPSAVPSVGPSQAPTTAPSAAPTTPATSTTDALIPVVVVLIVLAGLGLWLLRGRRRDR